MTAWRKDSGREIVGVTVGKGRRGGVARLRVSQSGDVGGFPNRASSRSTDAIRCSL